MKKMNNLTISGLKQRKAPTTAAHIRQTGRYYNMDVFRTDRIRNVVLLGHGGAGKTTLAEAMAYLAGMTSRLGRVEDGNTVSDFDKEEIKRHFSISTTLIRYHGIR